MLNQTVSCISNLWPFLLWGISLLPPPFFCGADHPRPVQLDKASRALPREEAAMNGSGVDERLIDSTALGEEWQDVTWL